MPAAPDFPPAPDRVVPKRALISVSDKTGLVEAARQLAGEAGERQITGAEVALAHGNGGELSSQATVILGTGATV